MPDVQREEPGAAGVGPGSLPMRLSALLADLARVPEVEIGSEWNRALGPGTVIGRFELEREVGRGGFGVVYEARDQDLGRKVAFKAVRGGSRVGGRGERLLREAEAAARLSHPNIVTLFDVGRSEHGPYLVLELLRGRTLARRLDEGPLTVVEALRVATEVAKGVAHAHANGVIHRDLTPSNVYLCEDGHVKVLDLGMANAFGRARIEGGTPGYMAPEQRRGESEDERTDVFALGVIMYRILTGKLPFDEDSGARRNAAGAIPGPPGLRDLVERMLSQDPAMRPRDGGEALASLTPLLWEMEGGRADVGRDRPRSRSRMWLASVVASGLAICVAGASLAVHEMDDGASSPRPASIAVMPFVDLSHAKDQEYYSDGLADGILSSLSRVDGLRVPGRASSFFFKRKTAKLSEVGRALNVEAVLEGSVRRSGSRVHVTAEIVSVETGERLWTQTYDRDLHEVFAVQDEIAGAVVSTLHVKVRGGAMPSMQVVATGNPEVYRQFLVGRHQYRRFTSESLRLSVEAFERALALEPTYAPAWAGLAMPLYFVATQEQDASAMIALRERALAAAERAVELAPNLPDALSSRGNLSALLRYDWKLAQDDLQHALSVDGGDADTHRRYATLLANLGRLPEAIVEARRATELDPLASSWTKLGVLYQATGELDLAEAAFQRDLQIWPDMAGALVGLGRNFLLASRPKEALAQFSRCDEQDRLWGAAIAEDMLGNAAASRRALDELAAKYGHTMAGDIAAVYAWRGEKDEAFEWLERAFAQHDGMMLGFRTDPFYRSLHGDPRFAALLRRMGLPM